MKTSVLIVGVGEIGGAIGRLLQKNKNIVVNFWDKDPAKIPNQKTLTKAVPQTDVIFLCVPSWAMKFVLKDLAPLLKPDTVVISLAKGLEVETQQTMDQLLEKMLPPEQAFALLGGPLLAEELNQDKNGRGVVITANKKVYKQVVKLFVGSNLKLEHTHDLHGGALVGVLKNIYAIGLGISHALKTGDNFRGWYAQEAIREMVDIVKLLNGEKATVYGTAGVADFIATGFSSYSRNHQAGDEIVQTGTCSFKSEGLISIAPLASLLGERLEDFSLLTALHKIISLKSNARQIFEQLS